MGIEGKTVVVIGGSSGIGLATAKAAAMRGARVVIASRSRDRLDAAAAAIGGDVVARALDVTDEPAVAQLFAEIGSVDHLVTTPVARASGPILELDLAAARQAFETKLFGAIVAVRAAVPRLAEGGSIALTAGTAAWSPMPGGAITGAVNGAVASLVRTLAVELAPIRVNAVAPGVIRTPTWDGMPADERAAMFGRIADRLPVGRVGEADDVAQAFLYLMESGFTTGTVVHVDGGHLLVSPSR